jgi:hypothetical protein
MQRGTPTVVDVTAPVRSQVDGFVPILGCRLVNSDAGDFWGKRNASWTCLVQTFGRAGANLGRDGLRCPFADEDELAAFWGDH